jgi:signal peptidase I
MAMAEKKTFLLDLFLLALIATILVKIFLFQTFKVESESMLPFLQPGDQILCLGKYLITEKYHDRVTGQKKSRLRIRRGDILVFRPPAMTDEEYVKRAIAFGNESVEIVSNRVLVNGEPLAEPYAHFDGSVGFYRDMDTSRVPDGFVFVMGDNRDHSSDSRSWGPVPLDRVEGKMVMVIWPLKHLKIVRGY